VAATPRPGGSRAYDGRLDPDDLDRAISLDVLGDGSDDGDTDGSGPVRRRERASRPLLSVAAVAAVVVGAAVVVAVTRPEPPPPMPSVSVSAGGEVDVRADRDRATGRVVGLGRLVVVSSGGRPDVEVRTLGVRGPGLAEEYARVPAVTAGSPRTGPVGAEVSCDDDAALDEVLAASATDYHVSVERVAAAGEQDVHDAPLPGADDWLAAVRSACVQSAAGRGLRVVDASAEPLAGAAATDLTLTLVNDSGRRWSDVRLVAGDGRAVVAAGDPADLGAGSSATVRAVVWSRDCADPVGDLAAGLVAEASVTPTDGQGFAPRSQFRLGLGDPVLAPIEAALLAQCAGTTPRLEVVRTKVRGGAQDDSAGAVEVVADIRVPAVTVGIGSVSEGAGRGLITAAEESWPVVDGTARVALTWRLPSCLSLLTRGAVQLPVRVFDGDLERRYLVSLRGEALRTDLTRLCGPTVAAIAR
jgi:hypothetical protein